MQAGTGPTARACAWARRSLGVGVSDRRVAVAIGIGLLDGVGWITRTRPNVLWPGAQLHRTAAVRAGPGLLSTLVYDLAVLTASGGACFGLSEWDRCVLGLTSTVVEWSALAVIEVIDGGSGVLGSFIPDECRRGFLGFVVGFGRALARGACGDRVGVVEGMKFALGLDVERSGETRLEEVLAESECRAGKFLRGALSAVDSFDTEGGEVLLPGGVDRTLFALAKDSVAGGALAAIVLGEFGAGEQLGGVGVDRG